MKNWVNEYSVNAGNKVKAKMFPVMRGKLRLLFEHSMEASLVIYDFTGKESIRQNKLVSGVYDIDVSILSKGMYVAKLSTGYERLSKILFIK